MKHYTILLHKKMAARLSDYLLVLQGGQKAGRYLQERLDSLNLSKLRSLTLLQQLINTKRPQIFAESEVYGDGSDWALTELGILGDISMAVPVTIFDNGHHTAPEVYETPWRGTLLFTPGALLRNGQGCIPADWQELVRGETLNHKHYFRLYERRLLPIFHYANDLAGEKGTQAFITIPGLGCGQFAGPFRGQLEQQLENTLIMLLGKHGHRLPHIRAIYYDPYSECDNRRHEINGISFLVRPLLKGNPGKPQLCRPEEYEEEGDNFKDCDFCSVVAWDHVSWPGNDFYIGNRATDDGVKAAATDSMAAFTGVEGKYDSQLHGYFPRQGHSSWLKVITQASIQLRIRDRLDILR